jgi:hypothetical protein
VLGGIAQRFLVLGVGIAQRFLFWVALLSACYFRGLHGTTLSVLGVGGMAQRFLYCSALSV